MPRRPREARGTRTPTAWTTARSSTTTPIWSCDWPGRKRRAPQSVGPGLFYRFRVGTDLELVCLDTSREQGILGGLIGGVSADGFTKRLILHPRHRTFIEQAFPPRTADSPKWIVPFFHHPVFCAG